MTTQYGDPNQEHKDGFLRGLEGSSRPGPSTTVAHYRSALSGSASVHAIDSDVADPLCAAATSFSSQCIKAVEAMEEQLLVNESEKVSESGFNYKSEDSPLVYVAITRSNMMGRWFVAPYDPNQLIALFPCLHLRKGYYLESFQLLSMTGNGLAYVFVMPAKRTLSKRLPQQALQHLLLTDMEVLDPDARLAYRIYQIYRFGMAILGPLLPSYRLLPAWARRDVEPFIEGDGSPLSYFQASICLREINELGKLWHDVYWGNHQVVTSKDTFPEEEWTWYEPEPADWRPQVWKDSEQRWNVSFYTVNKINAELKFHNDTFDNGYAFKTFSAAIADYPGACEV